MKHQVISNLPLNKKFRLITFKALDQNFTFESGQFVVVTINNSTFRCYSIFSTPQTLPFWQIFLDVTPMGPGCRYLSKLKPDDSIDTLRVGGNLIYKHNKNHHVLFSATGCGLAALNPIIETSLTSTDKSQITLFWGLRHKKDIVLKGHLDTLAHSYPNFSYFISLSQPASRTGKTGHVTSHLIEYLKNLDKKKVAIYLCGSSDYVNEARNKLLAAKIPLSKIYFESCY